MAKVKFLKTHKNAKIPVYKHKGDAGADISCVKDFSLYAGQREIIDTGLRIKVDDGYEVQVRPRSGLASKHGITVVNSPGTIDSGYTGPLKVILLNTSADGPPIEFKSGDRIAQIVISPVQQAEFEQVYSEEQLGTTDRGASGIGSTGTK